MKLSLSFLTCSLLILLSQAVRGADTSPVPHPELSHYAPLWERSIFTTKDLPSPDAPTGPLFSDSLSLAGLYEVDGQVVAVLVDRTSSSISEARIGSENEQGIKIRKVQPGATMDKTRVQLQKGDQAGWISFPEAAPVETIAPAIPVRQGASTPVSSPLLPTLPTATAPSPARRSPPPAPAPAVQSDVPLPPP